MPPLLDIGSAWTYPIPCRPGPVRDRAPPQGQVRLPPEFLPHFQGPIDAQILNARIRPASPGQRLLVRASSQRAHLIEGRFAGSDPLNHLQIEPRLVQ